MDKTNEFETELDKRQLEVQIKVQKRNGRKCTTIVEGLEGIDFGKDAKIVDVLNNIATHLRKKFNCSVAVMKPDNSLQMSGDHRDGVKEFLVSEKLVKADQIRMHGI